MIDRFVGRKIDQPKKEVITFMASKGVRTVTPYDDPQQMKVGDLWRSEHWQDYEGSSDLFPTALHEVELPVDRIKESIFSQDTDYIRRTINGIRLHCKLSGLDYDEFVNGLTYTPWERVNGVNRVMSADPAILGRYHIITLSPYTAYDVVEKGKIKSLIDRYGNMPIEEAEGLIALYEETRSHLDPNNCYIDETMTLKNHSNNSYSHFLTQVHRGVDGQKVDYKIKEREWRAIDFHNVRGATSPKGEDLLLTVKYPTEYRFNPQIILEEGASIKASTHDVPSVFSEIMFRRRRLQIFPIVDDSDFRRDLAFHCSRNVLLKPACSVLAYGSVLWDMFGGLMRKDGLVQVPVHFISDGRTAYLRLLD